MTTEVLQQREFYTRSAATYDNHHAATEHALAAHVTAGLCRHHNCRSILEVGAGTGRIMLQLAESLPHAKIAGIEPVSAMRDQAYARGISAALLTDGDVTSMCFDDSTFDAVCSFGVLHHVRDHERAVQEMLRVARQVIVISDSNNFGQGRWLMRPVKQACNFVGAWPLANFIKTRGRGYHVSAGDSPTYSYSVFSDYPVIRDQCRIVHMLNTSDLAAPSLYRGASHVVIVGVK